MTLAVELQQERGSSPQRNSETDASTRVCSLRSNQLCSPSVSSPHWWRASAWETACLRPHCAPCSRPRKWQARARQTVTSRWDADTPVWSCDSTSSHRATSCTSDPSLSDAVRSGWPSSSAFRQPPLGTDSRARTRARWEWTQWARTSRCCSSSSNNASRRVSLGCSSWQTNAHFMYIRIWDASSCSSGASVSAGRNAFREEWSYNSYGACLRPICA